MPRLLVVSHPAVLAVNQLPYAALRAHGWDPFVVTPAQWRNDYADAAFVPEVLPELAGRVVGRRVALAGRIQRHAYITQIATIIAHVRPDVAFLEEEPTSVPAFQWSRALHRAVVPFGLQCDENLDRRYPTPARAIRRFTLARAAFVAARSPSAAKLVQRYRRDASTPLIPHHVPGWQPVRPARGDGFVVGYAGRLVPQKGLELLIDAAAGIEGVTLRMIGDGPLRDQLERHAAARKVTLSIDTNVKHEQMSAAYATFDVLALPSLTTPTWAEQFGRVLVEALSCRVPVVGSDSGEIPWVIGSTGGGLVFPEGDVQALRRALVCLRDSPQLREELAERGRSHVLARFSVQAVAAAMSAALDEAVAGCSGQVDSHS